MNATKKKWALPLGILLVVVLLAIGFAAVRSMAGANDEKSTFLSTFQLDTTKKSVQLQEVYNDRGWFGDGTALYQVTLGDDGETLTAAWNDLPLSGDAETLLEWESNSITLPDITEGKWMLVDRGENSEASTNVSLCVFDEETGTAYYVTIDT